MKYKSSAFEHAEIKMNQLLSVATQKGGFEKFTPKENASLEKHTKIVKDYEDQNYSMPAIKEIS